MSAERPKILALDDQSIYLRMLHGILKHTYDVYGATCFERALRLCEQHEPDLLLLDLEMPDFNGIEVCRRLKEQGRFSRVPVIFVSATLSPEQEEACFGVGGVDFVRKPFSAPVLLARVATHLTLAQQAALLRKQTEALEVLSLQDGLTGVNNRRALDAYLEREFRACRREEASLGVTVIDIDHFKTYNDSYGHQAGDRVIKAVAEIVAKALRRPRDFVGRYGGEEFVTVHPHASLPEMVDIGEHLRGAVNDANIPHDRSTTANRITVSVGVASCQPRQGGEPALLLTEADRNLYRAKKAGRDQVCSTFPPAARL